MFIIVEGMVLIALIFPSSSLRLYKAYNTRYTSSQQFSREPIRDLLRLR